MTATYAKYIPCQYCHTLYPLDKFLHHVRWQHPDSPLVESIILALLDFRDSGGDVVTTALRTFRRAVVTLLCGCKYGSPANDEDAGLPGSDYYCEHHGSTVVIRRERRNW